MQHRRLDIALSGLKPPKSEPLFEPDMPNSPQRVREIANFLHEHAKPGYHLTYSRVRNGQVVTGKIFSFSPDGFSLSFLDESTGTKTPVAFSGVQSVLQITPDASCLPNDTNQPQPEPQEIDIAVAAENFPETLVQYNRKDSLDVTLTDGRSARGVLMYRSDVKSGFILNEQAEFRLDFTLEQISSLTIYTRRT